MVFLLDKFRGIFRVTVITITLRVIIFSNSYISYDVRRVRFHLLLAAFVLSILLLIMRPNLLSLLIGWDGLGLTSYLLVTFYCRKTSYKAGIITVLMNRVGDSLILVSLGLIYWAESQTLPLWSLRCESSTLFYLCAMLAAITKRAQIPFRAWLPAAIAAPTPVSALVHSSTLVTAGVYILIRFESTVHPTVTQIIAWIGALTTIIASARAFAEMDMKKIIALSTLRQLGVIVSALGSGICDLRFFHLLTHAYFKALLFIRAGSVIHNSGGWQDLRMIGRSETSVLSATIITSARYRLIGLPFISAFYSKEAIIESIACRRHSAYTYFLMLIGVSFTAYYRTRLLCRTYIYYTMPWSLHNSSENDLYVTLASCTLVVPAICGGRLLTWHLFGAPPIFAAPAAIKVVTLLLMTGGVLASTLEEALPGIPRTHCSIRMAGLWGLPHLSRFGPHRSIIYHGDYLYKLCDYSWSWELLTRFTFLSSVKSKNHSLSCTGGGLWRPLSLMALAAPLVIMLTY